MLRNSIFKFSLDVGKHTTVSNVKDFLVFEALSLNTEFVFPFQGVDLLVVLSFLEIVECYRAQGEKRM